MNTRRKPRVLFFGKPSQANQYLLKEIEPLVELKGLVWEHPTRRTKIRQFVRRAKKLGWSYPLSRVLLQWYVKLFQRRHRSQSPDWKQVHSASFSSGQYLETHTTSINDDCVQQLLANTEHDLVIVHGTSIIRKHILRNSPCFINLHAGITPEYRGAHGAVWAGFNRDFSNAGVTLHFIDEGIDTGGVIAQKRISLAASDSIETVNSKQVIMGVELLKHFLCDYLPPYDKVTRIDTSHRKSTLYYSPTFKQYRVFLRNIRQQTKKIE